MTHASLDIVEHRSDHGEWTLVRRAPAVGLRRHVLGYSGYHERGGRPVWRREVASPVIPLIFNFDEPWDIAELDRRGERPLVRSFVAGLHDRPVLVGSRGRALCLQVDMTPLGALQLLGLPMEAVAGHTVELRDVIGTRADRLDEALYEAAGWAERFALLDRVLLDGLATMQAPSPLVEAAWRAIEESAGQIAIGRLAARLGVSRKHLDAMCRAVGLPPKRLARIVRFSRALSALAARTVPLAELAHTSGYYDQAHFNRDFRAFAGEAPLVHVDRCLTDGSGAIEW